MNSTAVKRIMRRIFSLIRRLSFHPHPLRRNVITLIYVALALAGNFLWLQVFCMPVWWASLWIALVLLSILLFDGSTLPLRRLWHYPVLGAGVPVCIYLIVFLAGGPRNILTGYLPYLLGILYFGAGLLAFLPFYLLRHIYIYYKRGSSGEKKIFWTGVSAPLVALALYCLLFYPRFQSLYHTFGSGPALGEQSLNDIERDYFTERFLGIGFKYHTKIEFLYDGWRPPLHDPFLNTFLWFFGKEEGWEYYPLHQMDQQLRMTYYHYLFPYEPLKIACPCSYSRDGKSYSRDFRPATFPVRQSR